ncbi:PREDICTED: molybdopterin synthase catalytic subunit-like isoform X1 [Priapulus caudatus]|uniref:Molybdopterin synthase catalytic subunit n=1 Tax=Priapulus caudatus TaxID=37621 RepID=A0ABM1DZ24_PRICU|nr:PREDICTED: molybdopterin synthase catalytic subunit-like isoform X1 [Priapulus caudatus]
MTDHIYLTSEKLSVDEITQLVSAPDCGAVSLFVGFSCDVGSTRDSFEGRVVKQLEYEAYTPMAEAEMRNICAMLREKWRIKHIAVFHRLGVVPVMEASVIIAVSSEHRTDSLEAVSFAINALKSSVPIWKKEIYEEGVAEWKENKECKWRRSSSLTT